MVTITTQISVTKRPSGCQMRVYFHHEGETIVDNILQRRHRPHHWYEMLLPAVIREASIATAQAEHRYEHDPARTRWSQQAGCTCGCSPGFIVSLTVGYDLHVTVSTHTVFSTEDPRSPETAAP